MLYWLFKPLIRLTTRLYFRNFQVTGKENIPAEGPCLLVANHPATFMDALLIAAHTRRKVHFLSKSTVFRSKLAAWILPKFNMVPIYRRQDDPSQMNKNKDTFEQCYAHLGKNKMMLIFPEGISVAERKLKTLKTGAARIALGALEKGITDMKIVCIGLNYEKNGAFQTNAVMQIAPPIEVAAFLQEETTRPQEAVKKLTAKIAATLEEITVSIEEQETDVFVSRIEEMYKPVLVNELSMDKKDKSMDFFLTRKIVEYTRAVRKDDPWKLHAIKQQVDEYFGLLEKFRIGDAELRRVQNRRFFLFRFAAGLLYLLAGLPLFVYGILINVLPYWLTTKISRKMSVHTEFRVAISFTAGMFVYILYYFALLLVAHMLFDSFWINMVLLASFPLAGLYAYLYGNYFTQLYKKWRVFRLLYQRTDEMSGLFHLRKKIIGELNRVRLEPEVIV